MGCKHSQDSHVGIINESKNSFVNHHQHVIDDFKINQMTWEGNRPIPKGALKWGLFLEESSLMIIIFGL